MTPDELRIVQADGETVRSDAEAFSSAFYDTLFEIAPGTRALFPDDLVAQRGKLVDELGFLVAAASEASGDLDPFLARARELGRRHVGYGVAGADYEHVGAALLAALAQAVPDWDIAHERAWTRLYRLIADVMREGAEGGLFLDR